MVHGRNILVSLVLTLILTHSSQLYAKNLGHRMSGGKGEYHSSLPENSLSALWASLRGIFGREPIQHHEDFKYLEFDIRETKDNQLVVFHDKKIKRMMPEEDQDPLVVEQILNEVNESRKIFKERYYTLQITDLTLDQLKRLRLEGGKEQIPTLREVFNVIKEGNLIKPITVEVKHLHTDKARYELINTVDQFYHEYVRDQEVVFEENYDMSFKGISFLSFSSHFKKSFGKSKSKERIYWCSVFQEKGFNQIYKARKHSTDLCGPSYTEKNHINKK